MPGIETGVVTPRRTLLRIGVVLVLGTAALTVTGTSAAKQPCWARVIADWSDDGYISGPFSVACYREALKHIPEDLRDYTSIQDDIAAAMQATARTKKVSGGGDGSDGSGNGGGGPSAGGGNNGDGGSSAAPAGPPKPTKKATRAASHGLRATEGNALPVPVILLGSLVLLLLGAAGGVRLYRLLEQRKVLPRLLAARRG